MTKSTGARQIKTDYTRKEKVSAVAAAAASSVQAASEATGVPRSTLRHWLKDPEYADMLERTRADLADEFRVLAHAATQRLIGLVPSMKAHDLIVLASMSTDKSQLLSGGATGRLETRSITEGWDDHERDALHSAIRAELDRREVDAP